MKVTKQDWFASVSAFKKQKSSEKTAYYAQNGVEALMKKKLKMYVSSRVVSSADGGWRSLCFMIGYSKPNRAWRREGTSTLAESSRVT